MGFATPCGLFNVIRVETYRHPERSRGIAAIVALGGGPFHEKAGFVKADVAASPS